MIKLSVIYFWAGGQSVTRASVSPVNKCDSGKTKQMKWADILYAALFSSPESMVEPSDHYMARRGDVVFTPTLGQYVLYEAYMPIDAIVFLIGAYRPTDRELSYVVDCVLNAKNLMLADRGIVGTFANLSGILRESGEVGRLLKARNDMVAMDESFIIQNYVRRVHADISERIQKRAREAGAIESQGDDTDRDREYREMIRRLKYVVYENRNVGKALRAEKEEFYRKYRRVSRDEALTTKISLSLGGAIIQVPSMPRLIAEINIPSKEAKVREWVHSIMGAVEDLELRTKTKSLFEAKAITREFLEDCLRRKNGSYDSVFEVRSKILQLALGTKEKMEVENWRQESYIKAMIDTIENIRSGDWLVRYNKDIAEAYIVYLLTGQADDKNRLLNHFK